MNKEYYVTISFNNFSVRFNVSPNISFGDLDDITERLINSVRIYTELLIEKKLQEMGLKDIKVSVRCEGVERKF